MEVAPLKPKKSDQAKLGALWRKMKDPPGQCPAQDLPNLQATRPMKSLRKQYQLMTVNASSWCSRGILIPSVP
jgi:hypothetical protein